MCLALIPPPLPILPTLAQNPTLWIVFLLIIIGFPFCLHVMRTRVQGFARSFGILCIALFMLVGLIGAVTLGLYQQSSLTLFQWRAQTYQQCPTSSVDAAYSRALAQIEPLHSVYQIALICFQGLFLIEAGFMLYLARQRKAAGRNA